MALTSLSQFMANAILEQALEAGNLQKSKSVDM
jgi:hypothetical protein